ncbi:fluoride efflux transporter CrcB [Shimazuella alba]|uniref:Fluoride-specific ion channel FluC n=1 Tax=Shimazuella alba TaxID=2690964 RepID=A0A6I4VPV9_9BACL|nr:fluoride efflux transporter CrcB [Shimazuella alba]MXQ53103.1 fluoride efflux transporter CrcB [Shimazuella alba]
MSLWFIAIGGSIGALCRYFISKLFQKSSDRFPFNTFSINLIGTFLLGWLVGHHVQEMWMFFLGTGFCGSFTTFSTLNWEIFQLKQSQQTHKMIYYILLTYFLGILLAALGYVFGKANYL